MDQSSALGKNRRDIAAGLIFIAIAAVFVGTSFSHRIGSPLQMGPGFFPLVIASLLGLMGVITLLSGLRGRSDDGEEEPAQRPVPYRGMLLIVAGPTLFGLAVSGIGLAPATAVAILFGALASRDMGILQALATTIVLTTVCLLIFSWGLGIPIRLIGPWIS